MPEKKPVIFLVELSKIIVKDRARVDFGMVAELAESIRKHGLFCPIILDEDNNLIAGERRLRAVSLLKWETIPIIFKESLTSLEKIEIELEENLRRKNLTWQEEVCLKEKIHFLQKQINPKDWTIEKTADILKISLPQVKSDLRLAEALKNIPELVKENDKANAIRKVRRNDEQKIRSILVSADILTSSEDIKNLKFPVIVENKDSLTTMKELADCSVDLVITDPPYGVDFKNTDAKKNWPEVYKDDKEAVLNYLLPLTLKEMHRVMKNGAHFYMFTSSINCERFKEEAVRAGFNIQPIPLIWNKRLPVGNIKPFTYYGANYEMIIYGFKGVGRSLNKTGNAVLNFDSVREIKHPSEKPVELMEYLISQSTLEGELVLDPFCGSGATMTACVNLNRKGRAFEISENWFNLAFLNINSACIKKGERENGKEKDAPSEYKNN